MVLSTGQVLAYTLAAFVMIVIPGPGVLFIVGRALAHGRRIALATAVGHALGNLIVGAFISFGLGEILQRSAPVFFVVKIGGAAYLVWLGVQAIRHRKALADAIVRPGAIAGRRSVWDGILVGVTNPKAYLLFGAVLPQFVNRTAGNIPLQMMLLVLISVAIGVSSDCAWGLVAGGVRDWFVRSPRRFSMVGGTGGLALIGVGITVALTGRKS